MKHLPMERARIRVAALIACCAAAWQPSIARAADENTQLWLIGAVRTDLGEDTHATLDGSLRLREDARGGDEKTIRLTLEQEIADNVLAGGGAGVWDTETGETEVRIFQQLTITRGAFAARTRLEERIFDGADRVELRFRQRMQYTLELSGSVSASLDGEWLHLVQTRDRLGPQYRDQFRSRAAVTADLGNGLTAGIAYLAIYDQRGAARDRYAHVPQVSLDWRF